VPAVVSSVSSLSLSDDMCISLSAYSYYNKTKFTGLENSASNSYVNAHIQSLYFMPQLRPRIINHLCKKELCFACELAFLFRTPPIFSLCGCGTCYV
jgi:hypothetical protein